MTKAISVDNECKIINDPTINEQITTDLNIHLEEYFVFISWFEIQVKIRGNAFVITKYKTKQSKPESSLVLIIEL